MGSLRSSAQAHDLGHLATECLAANRNRSSGGPKRPAVVSQVNQVLVNGPIRGLGREPIARNRSNPESLASLTQLADPVWDNGRP